MSDTENTSPLPTEGSDKKHRDHMRPTPLRLSSHHATLLSLSPTLSMSPLSTCHSPPTEQGAEEKSKNRRYVPPHMRAQMKQERVRSHSFSTAVQGQALPTHVVAGLPVGTRTTLGSSTASNGTSVLTNSDSRIVKTPTSLKSSHDADETPAAIMRLLDLDSDIDDVPLFEAESGMSMLRPPLSLEALRLNDSPTPESPRRKRKSRRRKTTVEHGGVGYLDAATLRMVKSQQLYKTELCSNFVRFGSCLYGSKCNYAHGSKDRRPRERVANFKSQPCIDPVCARCTERRCQYAHRCNFAHPGESMRRQMSAPYVDREYFERLRFDFGNGSDVEYPFGIFI
ncbi:MAG: hypothetical protein MHM6MM_004322 [Cercozoa sp. M6MM]